MQSKILTFLPGLCLALMGTAQAVVTTNGCSMANVSCTLAELFDSSENFIVVDDKKFFNWKIDSDDLLSGDSTNTGDRDATTITGDDSGPDPAIIWGQEGFFGVRVDNITPDGPPHGRVLSIQYDIEILDPNKAIKDNTLILHADSARLISISQPKSGSFTAEETVFALDDLITPITTKTVTSGLLITDTPIPGGSMFFPDFGPDMDVEDPKIFPPEQDGLRIVTELTFVTSDDGRLEVGGGDFLTQSFSQETQATSPSPAPLSAILHYGLVIGGLGILSYARRRVAHSTN